MPKSAFSGGSRVASLGRKIPQPSELGYGLIGLGQVALLKCDFRSAAKYLEQSLSERKGTGDFGTAAESQLALADLSLEEKHFSEAESMARESLNEFIKEHQEDQRAVAQALVSEALLGRKQILEAQTAAEIAVKLADSSEDQDSKINVDLYVWMALDATGQQSQAVERLRSALRQADNCKSVSRALEARAALAVIRLELGDRSAEQELGEIRQEAQAKGLPLIARKASLPKQSIAIAQAHN